LPFALFDGTVGVGGQVSSRKVGASLLTPQHHKERETRMSDKDKMRNVLNEATAIIDLLDKLRPPKEQFGELATEAYRVINNVTFTDKDMYAESWYQLSRIDELAGETRVFHDYQKRLSVALEWKENAVKKSKEGAGINLAFYEEDLARFRDKYPNVEGL
jgi:hypothetical protein